MKLTFLGSGSFFAGPDNFHSNIVLEAGNGKRLLLDCGYDVFRSLYASGLTHKDIEAIYVSHPHGDHAGGLEAMGFAHYFECPDEPLVLFCHPDLTSDLWDKFLAISMGKFPEQPMKMSSYFSVKRAKTQFEWQGLSFKLVPGIHVVNHAAGHLWSYGLTMTLNGVRVYWTSDITYSSDEIDSDEWDLDAHWNVLRRADVIFHDCETINQSQVHPHYDLLKTFPDAIKSKMWLYHTQSSVKPDAKADGFLGIVQRGQVFDF